MTVIMLRYFVILLLAVAGVSVAAQGTGSEAMQRGTEVSGAEVNGQIQDSQGEPVPDAMVQLRDASGGLLAAGTTDGQGRFDLSVGSQGPLRIDVSDGGAEESANLDASSFGNFVMRLSTVHVVSPATTSDTISLNDLEAPKAAKSKLAKAEKALDARQFEKAWTLINEAVAAAPDWGKAYFVRGVLNLENRAYPAARADLTKSLQKNPANPAALTELGKLYSTTGAYQLSDTYLRQALKYPPVLWPTYWELATLDLYRGNYAEAATMATNAEYSTPPAPISVHYLAGQAAFRLGRWNQARQEFSSYLKLAGQDQNSAIWIGRARNLLAHIPTSTPAAAQPAAPAH